MFRENISRIQEYPDKLKRKTQNLRENKTDFLRLLDQLLCMFLLLYNRLHVMIWSALVNMSRITEVLFLLFLHSAEWKYEEQNSSCLQVQFRREIVTDLCFTVYDFWMHLMPTVFFNTLMIPVMLFTGALKTRLCEAALKQHACKKWMINDAVVLGSWKYLWPVNSPTIGYLLIAVLSHLTTTKLNF